ncbi:MAG: hypothetical protein ACKVP0_04965 [Pirellulaceae bacterium]
MRYMLLSLIAVAAGLAGCGTSGDLSKPGANSAPAVPDARYVLSEEPAEAKTVIEARKDAKDGDDVTITGRIGGDIDPWVKGRAAFLIVDPSLVPCSEIEGDTCKTPWDYCCDTDRLAECKATIKFVDQSGQTLATDARQLLGVKELQRVTIRGKAKRDEAGNLTVLARGIYVKR